MSVEIYRELLWLPRPPEDFAARCRTVADTHGDLGQQLRGLAGYGLDENQLVRLARVIERERSEGRSAAPLVPFRLGIVGNATTHHIVPALVATAPRHGIALECVEAAYDQTMQEALSPDSLINRSQLDAVLLVLDFRGLPLRAAPGDADTAAVIVESCLDQLQQIRAGFRQNGKTISILPTLVRPPETQFGGLDLAVFGSLRNLIDTINRRIADSISATSDLLLDVAGLAETVGLAEWHDPTTWNMGKFPFSSLLLPLYADHVCRLIAALLGKSRRCLILDLDNTVWSGVIGDDGLEGIIIGEGDPTGEAHLAVQRTALMLRERGIVLAVSSKNHDEVARRPFRDHPEMLLKEDHFAVFQANWSDKASNIEAIAEALSLGLDAMVFLDDNPVERDLIRRRLSQVAVPELPPDPALYARTLLAAGYFEAIAFSDEDRRRAQFYQENTRRAELQQRAGDIDEYLASLEMEITFQPFDQTGRARIAQLINKSNQFNLTTRRYSEAEVAAAERDPDCFTLQVRLADRFGDNGMISVIICRRVAESWDIDTWLMSCRVLGRKVEHAVLRELIEQARRSGIRSLAGHYHPTGRNQLVEEHYQKLGFRHNRAGEDGSTFWALDMHGLPDIHIPIKVRRIVVGEPVI
jgi:FkbH-like protein